MAGIAMMTIAISSCDDETNTLGGSVTDVVDKFMTVSQSYNIESKSIQSDAVLATSLYRYLGKIKDPETNSYISCDYMTQFNILENEYKTLFPSEDVMVHKEDGKPVADSCFIRIMINSFQGDSLAAMKLKLCELGKPVPNGRSYYTDFDPEEEGYLRTGANAIKQSKVYSVSDLNMTDSLRKVLRGTGYYKYITIPLNKEYIDKDNKKYKNYGTYILQKWYEDKTLFKNSNTFANRICPGFYLKTTDGETCMLEVANTQLLVFYKYKNPSTSKEVATSRAFVSTQEVLQTTHIINDQKKIHSLVTDSLQYTYLKTPAGIYTEVTLPIDSIKWLEKKDASGKVISASHVNDTIVSASITFQALKNHSELTEKMLKAPTNLLMLQLDKVESFFEKNSAPDYITSYLATYNSVQKTYSFNSITSLINYIYTTMKPAITNADGSVNKDKVKAYIEAHPNWNKVVLIHVSVTYTTSNYTSSVSSLSNSLNISSVRLIGGEKSKFAPVTVNVKYSKTE